MNRKASYLAGIVLGLGLVLAGAGCKSKDSGPSGISSSEHYCPMHPDVEQGVPGKCPDCGMNLVKRGHESEHGH